jgi:hypothetical protein
MLRRGVSLAIGALGAFESEARESELVKRVKRILTMPEPSRSSRSLRIAAGAVLAGALGFSILLARSPRLINFASAPATVAQGSPNLQSLTPALPMSQTEDAKPTLVKAVMSGPGTARAMVRPALLHKHPVARHRTSRAYAEPVVQVPVWHNVAPASAGVMTLVSAGDSQRLYAAVRFQGGWFVFQL